MPEPYPELPILILDDDEALRVTIALTLAKAGIDNDRRSRRGLGLDTGQ